MQPPTKALLLIRMCASKIYEEQPKKHEIDLFTGDLYVYNSEVFGFGGGREDVPN